MAQLLGFEFNRPKLPDNEVPTSFASPQGDDGAVVVTAGGTYGTYVDLDGSVRTEAELVTKYREMSMHPEVELAIDDIVNESIVLDFDDDIIEVVLDDLKQSDTVNKAIQDEFSNILELLDFNNLAYDIYKRWYVDGRLYYHAIVNEKAPADGIQELRYIDPRKIRKIREQKKKRVKGASQDLTVNETIGEYYLYNDKGFAAKQTTNQQTASGVTGIKIAKDSIVYVTSGLLSQNNDLVLSHLHKAIKPLNQLKSMEDATIIYKLARAPDRRVFYIDIGNLPKLKAEQYVRDMMTKFKNKVVYDATTGEVRDDRKFMTMLEDFWLPRREGGRGTEVTTLNGSTSFDDMTSVEYFQRNMYKSLNIPVSRLQADAPFNMGRNTEISRDEVKFSKFVKRLRAKFSQLFTKILERQLVLKGIVTIEDWDEWRNLIKFRFNEDNMFEEFKETEILSSRINMLKDIQPFIGVVRSWDWAMREIMKMTEEDIAAEKKQIAKEKTDPILYPPMEDPNAPPGAGAPPGAPAGPPGPPQNPQ